MSFSWLEVAYKCLRDGPTIESPENLSKKGEHSYFVSSYISVTVIGLHDTAFHQEVTKKSKFKY